MAQLFCEKCKQPTAIGHACKPYIPGVSNVSTTKQPNLNSQYDKEIEEISKTMGWWKHETEDYYGYDGSSKKTHKVLNLIIKAQIEILEKVKSMGVYQGDINNPNNHFVWSWKLDREINELQSQLKDTNA